MKNLRDFHCGQCDRTQERIIDVEVEQVICECGGTARRMIGSPMIQLEGLTGAFPGAHDRWARIREEKFIKNRRVNYENGV